MIVNLILLLLCSKLASSAEIFCEYSKDTGSYSCNLPANRPNILVSTENEPIVVTGNHLPMQTNDDVIRTSFAYPHNLKFVPTKFFEIFKNIQLFYMIKVKLSKMTTNAFTNCLSMELIEINDNNFPILPASKKVV